VLLPDGEKLWDPGLRRIDAELEDEGLLDVMVEALARRRPLSSRRGRPGTPATVSLRMLVLKHLFDWSLSRLTPVPPVYPSPAPPEPALATPPHTLDTASSPTHHRAICRGHG